jgi:glycosyltransferase involved in cell wall biosynthesis
VRLAVIMPTLPYPHDLRAETEMAAFLDSSYDVAVLAAGGPGVAPGEQIAGVRVERIEAHPLAMKLSNFLLKVTSYQWHPVWSPRIKRMVSGGVDAVHVHELKPFMIAARAARRSGVQVVLDLREDYPEMERGAKRKLAWRLFNSIAKIDRIQRRALARADSVLVVSPMVIDVFAGRYPEVPSSKFVLVSNYADVAAIDDILATSGAAEPEAGFNITYVGSMGSRERGIQTAIDAMPTILGDIPDARLVLVGGGGYVRELQELVAEKGLERVVDFVGQVDFTRVPSFIQQSTICIVPSLNETAETDMALPHKLFQYMLLERPVVVSDCHELKRVVEGSGAGLVFTSGDPADFAAKVTALADAGTRSQMGARGKQAVLEEYNFAMDAKRMTDLYSRLTAKGPGATSA